MKRVVIIGSPGAGKTTFAKKLAGLVHLPLQHLDLYYHDTHFDYEHEKKIWHLRVKELASEPEWIIDGNYKSTFDIRFQRADTIIFLDYSRLVALTRAVGRRIAQQGKLRDDMPSSWKEKLSPAFISFIWSYNKIERPTVHKLLNELKNKKIIILRNSREANQFLAGVNSDLPQ